MVAEMTGLPIANASLLDESTAAAEAMVMMLRSGKGKHTFLVADDCHPQTIDVIKTRAEPIGIKVVIGNEKEALLSQAFAVLLQYPSTNGEIHDYSQLTKEFIVSSNHFYAFLIISLYGFQIFIHNYKNLIILYLFSSSVILELSHLIIPNRSFQFSDMFGNIAGVIVSFAIIKLINYWRKK